MRSRRPASRTRSNWRRNLVVPPAATSYWSFDANLNDAGAGSKNLAKAGNDNEIFTGAGLAKGGHSLGTDGTGVTGSFTNAGSILTAKTNEAWTLACWMKPGSVSTITITLDDSTGGASHRIRLICSIANRTITVEALQVQITVPAGRPTHLCAVGNSGSVLAYFDGVLRGTMATTDTHVLSGQLAVAFSSTTAGHTAAVDDLVAYNVALTEAQVRYLAAGNHPV